MSCKSVIQLFSYSIINIKYKYLIGILLGLFLSPNVQAQQTTERIDDFNFGIGMTIIAMGVVILGLIGLFLLFNLISSIVVSLYYKRAMKSFGISKEEAKDITKRSGEIYAAIAMAIYEATEMHDEENMILTIKNTVSNYSPWSSKIYTLRETPRRM